MLGRILFSIFNRLDKFKNILVVMKIAKYVSLQLDIIKSTSSHLEELINKFEGAKTRHEVKCHNILTSMKQFGLVFDFKPLSELNSIIKGYDLVITLGGDGTFLRTASFITDETPIMGLNTDSERSHCSFCSFNPKIYLIEPRMIWQKISNKEYEIRKRTRIQITLNDKLGEPTQVWRDTYALNEVLYADTDVGKSSYFRLSVDGKDYLSYKSSGIIISTGSGSTGWIKSAMNVEPDLIKDILWEKEQKWLEKPQAKDLSRKLAKKYFFEKDANNLLYCIREPIIQTEEEVNKPYKGFAKNIKIQSAMGSSVLILDGMVKREITFGSVFTLEPAKAHLNSLHLTFQLFFDFFVQKIYLFQGPFLKGDNYVLSINYQELYLVEYKKNEIQVQSKIRFQIYEQLQDLKNSFFYSIPKLIMIVYKSERHWSFLVYYNIESIHQINFLDSKTQNPSK